MPGEQTGEIPVSELVAMAVEEVKRCEEHENACRERELWQDAAYWTGKKHTWINIWHWAKYGRDTDD